MKKAIYALILIFLGSGLSAQVQPHIRVKRDASPSKALLLSAVLPGAGQFYSGHARAGFIYSTVELGLIGYAYWNQMRGDRGVSDYTAWADAHWDVKIWLEGNPDPAIDNPGYYANLTGNPRTHNVNLKVDGVRYTFSEFIEKYPNRASLPDNYSIDAEYHYYENIGKYKQFKQGWDDYGADPDFETLRRASPDQEHYSLMRQDANSYLKMAEYMSTAIMFNHLVSAIDAMARVHRDEAPRVQASAFPVLSREWTGTVFQLNVNL